MQRRNLPDPDSVYVYQVPPNSFVFSYTHAGKPYLSTGEYTDAPKFNLSHSSDLTVIAVSALREVGVDIEKLRQVSNLDEIASNHFTTVEQEFLDLVPRHQRSRRFLVLWTRREAVAKAQGLGLSAALTQVHPPVYGIGGSVRIECGSVPADCGLQDLRTDFDAAAALCYAGPPCPVRYERLDSLGKL